MSPDQRSRAEQINHASVELEVAIQSDGKNRPLMIALLRWIAEKAKENSEP